MEFKIGNQVLLHRTKAEKQWSGKFDPKWDGPFHIHKVLRNGAYKLRLEDRILKKVAYGNRYDTKIRTGEGRMKVQLELNVPSPTHHSKGNVGGKIVFEWRVEKKEAKNEKKFEEIKEALTYETKLLKTGEWTPDNAQEWKKKLPPAYWFYKIGKQLDLKIPYEDFSQKTFNKEAIQQVEKFIGKNNLTLHYKAAYQLYATFQHCPNVLLNGSIKTIMVNSIEQITNQQFEDLQKAILEATIKHYTNEAMITNTYGFVGAQF
ncbi:hypothetical protein G9A89_021870 [Geosiphon pyriformis]|nr:hypothetical protein G9A89_021870 [Geosiphon pyriformis]